MSSRHTCHATPEDALTAFFAEHAPEAAEPIQAFARSLVQGTITEVRVQGNVTPGW